jgi:hypothetical protein
MFSDNIYHLRILDMSSNSKKVINLLKSFNDTFVSPKEKALCCNLIKQFNQGMRTYLSKEVLLCSISYVPKFTMRHEDDTKSLFYKVG